MQSQLETDIWQQLLRASADKHHEWRSPILVTNGLKIEHDEFLYPEARTIILRKVDVDTKTLTFYTDSRSPKVTQITANPHALLVFWSKRLNWQLRVKVAINVDIDSELNKLTWQKVKQSPSATDYLSANAPGEKLETLNVKTQLIQNQTAYFAMLVTKVESIDWLALSRNGHQRAQIDAHGVTYLTP